VTRLEEVAQTPLLDAGERTWTWGDLFLAARLWGEWEPWIAGLAGRPVPADPKGAEVSFRRARRLIAGDELRAWLAEQHLTVDDWRAWLGGEPGEPWTAGVCDGSFDVWADRLAERAGALAAADPPPAASPPPAAWFGRMPGTADALALGIPADAVALRAEALWSAERAYESLCAEAAGADAVARLVTDNSVDWLRVDCELIEAADEDVAREAALLVREDGLAMPEVARIAGLPLAADRVYVVELPEDLRPRLVSAAPGELVGPIAVNGHYVLAQVHAKLVPTSADPDIRARAEQAAIDGALARVVREQVRRHGRE